MVTYDAAKVARETMNRYTDNVILDTVKTAVDFYDAHPRIQKTIEYGVAAGLGFAAVHVLGSFAEVQMQHKDAAYALGHLGNAKLALDLIGAAVACKVHSVDAQVAAQQELRAREAHRKVIEDIIRDEE